jgi:hypothetical protein
MPFDFAQSGFVTQRKTYQPFVILSGREAGVHRDPTANTVYFVVCVVIIVASLISSAQDTHFPTADQRIPVPECVGVAVKDLWFPGSKLCGPNEHEAWLEDITHWRNERRIRVGYDGSRYDRPEFKWTQSSFIQPQMMVHDRYFYDPVAGKYTVDRYLDDLEKWWGD